MQWTISIFAKDRRILLEQQGIIFTGRSEQADIVISRYASNFAPFRRVKRLIKNRKLQFLIWTDEPRYNFTVLKKDGIVSGRTAYRFIMVKVHASMKTFPLRVF